MAYRIDRIACAFLLACGLLVGCAPQAVEEPAPTRIVFTAAPKATRTAPSAVATQTPLPPRVTSTPVDQVGEIKFQFVTLPDKDASFHLPEGWKPFGEEYGREAARWSPDGGKTLFGFRRARIEGQTQPETVLLPKNGVVADRSQITVREMTIQRYDLNLFPFGQDPKDSAGKVERVQVDLIVRQPDGPMTYDFYFSLPAGQGALPDGQELKDLDPVITQFIDTLTWGRGN